MQGQYEEAAPKFVVGEGGMRMAMEDLAKALGVYDKVYFTGFVDDKSLRELYQCADVCVFPSPVCVFPSLYEPFGIVTLEAMAAGTQLSSPMLVDFPKLPRTTSPE